MKVKIEAKVFQLAKGRWYATTELGGILVRSAQAKDAQGAMQNLCYRLSRPDDEDAELALALALEGRDIGAELHDVDEDRAELTAAPDGA